MGRLEGKVVVVTGGALGIGRSACILCAQEGAKVAICDILDTEGHALFEEIGGNAKYWHMDVANEQSVHAAIEAIATEFGGIDVLVNNAGIAGTNKPTHELTEEEWDQVQAVNVKGVFFCTKHVIPHLRRRGGGSIINLSSIYGIIGAPDVPPYHASKGAVRLMTKTDALIYAQEKIRVNSIHPGYIWTPMVEGHLKRSGVDLVEGRKALDALHPLGHVGEPDDIGWAIVFLASNESKFITGEEIVIDGGYTAR